MIPRQCQLTLKISKAQKEQGLKKQVTENNFREACLLLTDIEHS